MEHQIHHINPETERHRKIILFLVIGIVLVLIILVGSIIFVLLQDADKKQTSAELEKKQTELEKTGEPSPVSEQCQFACDSNQKTSFCDIERKVTESLTATCKELSQNSQYAQHNVQTCPSIDCNPQKTPEQIAQESDQTCVTGLGASWESLDGGNCPIGGDKQGIKLTPSDNPPSAGQACCI